MALSTFDDKTHPPTEGELADALADAAGAWQELYRAVTTRFAPVTATWGFASKSTGWGLRLQGPARTILYMTPRDGSFLASLALGERAAAAALEEALPPRVLDAIRDAPRYAEGRGVRIEVRDVAEVADILRLAEVKLAH